MCGFQEKKQKMIGQIYCVQKDKEEDRIQHNLHNQVATSFELDNICMNVSVWEESSQWILKNKNVFVYVPET